MCNVRTRALRAMHNQPNDFVCGLGCIFLKVVSEVIMYIQFGADITHSHTVQHDVHSLTCDIDRISFFLFFSWCQRSRTIWC